MGEGHQACGLVVSSGRPPFQDLLAHSSSPQPAAPFLPALLPVPALLRIRTDVLREERGVCQAKLEVLARGRRQPPRLPAWAGCWSCHQIRRYRLWVGSSHCGFPHGGGTKGLPGPGSPESASPSLLEPSALSLLPYPLTRARCTSCPPRSIQEGTPGMFPGYPVPEVQSPHTLAPVVWEGGENPRGCLLTPSLLLKSPRIPHVVEADGRI